VRKSSQALLRTRPLIVHPSADGAVLDASGVQRHLPGFTLYAVNLSALGRGAVLGGQTGCQCVFQVDLAHRSNDPINAGRTG